MRNVDFKTISYPRRRDQPYVLDCLDSQKRDSAKIRHPAVREVISAIIRYEHQNFIPPFLLSCDQSIYDACATILRLGEEDPISEEFVIAFLHSAQESATKAKIKVEKIGVVCRVMNAPDFLTSSSSNIDEKKLSFRKFQYALEGKHFAGPVKKVLDILIRLERGMLEITGFDIVKRLFQEVLSNPKTDEEILNFLRSIEEIFETYINSSKDPNGPHGFLKFFELSALACDLVEFLKASITEYQAKIPQRLVLASVCQAKSDVPGNKLKSSVADATLGLIKVSFFLILLQWVNILSGRRINFLTGLSFFIWASNALLILFPKRIGAELPVALLGALQVVNENLTIANAQNLFNERSAVPSAMPEKREMQRKNSGELFRGPSSRKANFQRKKTLDELQEEWSRMRLSLEQRCDALRHLQEQERQFFNAVSGQPDHGQYEGYEFWKYAHISEQDIDDSYVKHEFLYYEKK